MRSLLLTLSLTGSYLLSASPATELSELTKDHTQFAHELYKVANPSGDNFIFSPYSVATCLSMVYLGARGDTQIQMQQALHLEIEQKNLAKTAALLHTALTPKSEDKNSYKWVNANSIWVDQSIFLLTDFRYAIDKQFKATLNKLNFAKKQEALSTINNWVDTQTEHKIPQILSPEDITELTRLVLVNAIYFEGNWVAPFNPSKTQDWPFHPSPDASIPTKMMQQVGTFPYYENELIQIAALPFQGKSTEEGSLAFLIVLPKSAENFDMMQGELPKELNGWISSLTPSRLHVKIPKFIHNTRLDLNEPLQEMGMEDAFTSEANFTGIDGMRDLFLNKVIHQAYFSVNEQGVVATAATAANIGLTSAASEKSNDTAFFADHPFFYFIIDIKSQELLFMGKMAQPGSS